MDYTRIRVESFLVVSFLVSGIIAAMHTPFAHAQVKSIKQVANQTDYQKHPNKDDIDFVLQKRVMWNYADGIFKPNAQLTQGQLLTSLVALMQLKEKVAVSQLPDGHWAKEVYEKANKVGILAGVTIDPNRPLTKEEAALIVNNAWKPYRGGIWPGVTNYQHLIARGILPKVWGQTPESPFLRSEGAQVFKFLYIEFNGMLGGNRIADQFHNSLRLSNGVLTGVVPNANGFRVEGLIYKIDGSTMYFKPGMTFKVKAIDVKHMLFSVFIPGKGESVTRYLYKELPKLTRINDLAD
ncbi:S-layer homology domain-containing protein [Brevibacillus centrosporus]|uniref:S-layer homology domain-containing protein n=1 Tax=Brevibacillus centrosporus TaxID=54910 RepID=UPI003B021E13